MKKTGLPVFLAVCLFLACFSASAEAEVKAPYLQSADAALVVDLNTDTILYELNKDEYHSIASLTKMMTCLLAVEAVEQGRAKLDDKVTAEADCLQGLDVSSSNAGITPGEIMTYQDLIYCALVHSANDACNVLGTYLEGSIGAFVNRMNERAEQLGCTNTHFVDTNGMLNRTEGHYSCPYDLYLIGKEALSHPLFAEVCSTADYMVSASNYRPEWEIHNSNALMSSKGLYGDGYFYDGVYGIKTGFTKPAGYCLVSVCQRRDVRIMVIVLGCNGPLTYTFAADYQNFQDSVTLYDWAFTNFKSRTIYLAGEPLQRFAVENAKDGKTVALCPVNNLNLALSTDVTDEDITVMVFPDEGALVAPITQGQELGTVRVYIHGSEYSSARLVADADVELDAKVIRAQKIHDFFNSKTLKVVLILLVVILIGLIALRMWLRVQRQQQVQRRLMDREEQRFEQRSRSRQTSAQRTAPINRTQRPPEMLREQRPVQPGRTPVIREQRPGSPDTGRTPVIREAGKTVSPERRVPVIHEAGQPAAPVPKDASAGTRPGGTPVRVVQRPQDPGSPAGNRESLPQNRTNAAGHAGEAPKAQERAGGTKIVRMERPAAESARNRTTVIHDMSSGAQRAADAPRRVEKPQSSMQSMDAPEEDYDLDSLLAAFRDEYRNSDS